MNEIAGIPYAAARFDKDGNVLNAQQVTVPPGTTDLFVVSHGWNNTEQGAEKLYHELFANFAAVAPDQVQTKKLAIVGVIWPSTKFTDVVEAAAAERTVGGAAGLQKSSAADETIKAKLDLIAKMFDKKAAAQIKNAKAQISKLDFDPAGRNKFVDELRSLLDPSAAHDDDNSKLFFKMEGSTMLERLKAPTPLVAAAGDIFSGIKAGAIRFLNYFIYYEMKQRAGVVGQKGVGPMLDRLAVQVQRIHLVGHSFGGRVVTAAAAASTTGKLQTMTLLQAAFSDSGFSRSMNGFFRSVVDNRRIKGPILVTYTPNDRAVGIAYLAASRLSGNVSSAFGDEDDKFGGLGRKGAQKMDPGEVVSGVDQLLAVGGRYPWQPSRVHNLESSKYIVDPNGGDAHGFVTGKEVAWAISRAIAEKYRIGPDFILIRQSQQGGARLIRQSQQGGARTLAEPDPVMESAVDYADYAAYADYAPVRKSERLVNTGVADRAHPGVPIDPWNEPLLSGESYYFWLEVGPLIAGSMETSPTPLPDLPTEARLTVTLFGFKNEIELLNPQQTGQLQIDSSGRAKVSRPAERPVGVDDDVAARRLFFAIAMPHRTGSFRLRCHIYCEQVLLQSRLATVRVETAPDRAVRQEYERRRARWYLEKGFVGGRSWADEQTGKRTLASDVDYVLSRTFDSAQLAELSPHRLSIMVNDNGNGTHGFRFFGYDGNEYFKDDASIPGNILEQLVAMPRHALNAVSWGTAADWDGQLPYLYKDGLPDYKRLTNDLARLAVAGFRVYSRLAHELGRKNSAALEELTRHSGTFQIALKESANSAFPAALIYDYNFDSDAFLIADGNYTLCPAFQAALQTSDLLENCACFHGDCPIKAEINIILKEGRLINEMGPKICPSGFWGYRHAIGLPLSVKDAPDAPTQISFKQAPSMGVGIATTLQGWPAHEAKLRKLRPDLGWLLATTRDEVLKMLKATGSHLIYFYCHGGVTKEEVPFLVVGSQEMNISPDTLFAEAISWKNPRPLVFINGCHTTAITPDIALQFVNPFVQQADAAGVIGTDITVFEPLASAFAEECLKRFFAGDPIGDAVRGARLALLKQGNPLGLAYVPFVLPSLRLRQAPD